MNEPYITSKLLIITPPYYAEKCILHWDANNGWLIEMWINKNFGTPNRYVVTKTRVISGIFGAMLALQEGKIKKEEYFMETEEQISKIAYGLVAEDIVSKAKVID